MFDTSIQRSCILESASSPSEGTKRLDSRAEEPRSRVIFGELAFEAAYSFVADESSSTVVIGGPFSFLKKRTQNESYTRTSSLRELKSSAEESRFPTSRRMVDVAPGTCLQLARNDKICDQHAFRNAQYPLEAAIAAVLLCAERWKPERKRLQGRPRVGHTCRAKVNAGVDDIISECGSLKNSDGAERLRRFDVIASRRAIRALLCFLFPNCSPYGGPFKIDITISGNTAIFTVVTECLKSQSIGYGLDFENLLVQPACVTEVDSEGELKEAAELTNGYVVYSMLLCGVLRVAVSAETDAVVPQFNPLKHTLGPGSCCSIHGEGGQRACVFTRQTVGSNECLVHKCSRLSLLEEQLLQLAAPLAELKSFSEGRGLAWESTADQMRLGGARMLICAPHIRGNIRYVQVLPVTDVEKEANTAASDKEKWYALTALLQKLHELAANARSQAGGDVGCVRVAHDGISSFLNVTDRGPENIRVSREVASWFQCIDAGLVNG
ncbi:hypothetical protein Efla_000653 [Eimeria flavescens]